MKKIAKEMIMILLSFIISVAICYYFVDDVFVYFGDTVFSFITLRIVLTVPIYICINWVIEKSINPIVVDIMFLGYFFLIILVSIIERCMTNGIYQAVNMNLKDIFNYDIKYAVGNLLVYIPIGCYSKLRLKSKNRFLLIGFIIFITSLEYFQYLLKIGAFDINDILSNILGFIIGFLVFSRIKILQKIFVE